jgi:hypothetical protein
MDRIEAADFAWQRLGRRNPFPCPISRARPPEPLREGALVFAPIAAQTTGKILYKLLLALVQTQPSHQSTPVQRMLDFDE